MGRVEGVPATAVMMSPATRPAWAAGLPATTDSCDCAAAAVGIQAPLSTGRPFAFLSAGSIVSKRMPSHGRASGWPADAWASSGRAMSIGIAKPMPWLWPATAVLMPMTLPLGSSSGPPLLPGLIAVSVWMRLVSRPPSTGMRAAEGRDDAAGDRVGELAERAADGDRLLADLDRRRVADRGGRQAGLPRP